MNDRNNRIYYVPPWEEPGDGQVNHSRWDRPLRGGLLIVAMDPLTGNDVSLPECDVTAYQRELVFTAQLPLTLF